MRDIFPVVVDGLWRQGAKNLAVRLVSAEGQPLPAWTPGAHIDLHLPCGLIRQYSLTGSPAERDHYLLCIAREAQSRGGSGYVHDTLRPGQPLMISAPRNHFPLHEGGHVVLLAAGIGITPLLAMAHARAASGATTRFLWFISARACSTWATGASSITSETGLSLRAAGATASGSSRSSRLIHRIMLFPFTLPAPRWRFTPRRRGDLQLTGRQPAHPPARGQLIIHAHPPPFAAPVLQKPRPACAIPGRAAIAPL